MDLVDVGADDDDEIGAVAGLRQRRHEPAARLQHAEVAVLALGQRVIDDAARAVGERHDGAHAFDVGREAAEERQAGGADELGGGRDSIGERDGLAVDVGLVGRRRAARSRRWREQQAFLLTLRPFSVGGDLEIVAENAAEGAGHVLVRVGFAALAFTGCSHGLFLPTGGRTKAWTPCQNNKVKRCTAGRRKRASIARESWGLYGRRGTATQPYNT